MKRELVAAAIGLFALGAAPTPEPIPPHVVAAPSAASPSLGGIRIGEQLSDVLHLLGVPSAVETRDDGIYLQWNQSDGLDREVLCDEQLVVHRVLVAEAAPSPGSRAHALAQPDDMPLIGDTVDQVRASFVSRGAESMDAASPGSSAWRLGGDVAVALIDASGVTRLQLLDDDGARALGYENPPLPAAEHSAVRLIKYADAGTFPKGVGVAVSVVHIDASGAVSSAAIIATSGDHAIDDWVLTTAQRSTYAPATCGGVACAGIFVDINGML